MLFKLNFEMRKKLLSINRYYNAKGGEPIQIESLLVRLLMKIDKSPEVIDENSNFGRRLRNASVGRNRH